MALSAKIYMRPPATTGETNTFAPSAVVLATWPLLASHRHERALRRDDPQLAAGENRPIPARGAGKLRDPAHLAVGPRQRHELAVHIDDEDRVARRPRHLRAGHVPGPQPLARGFRHRDHPAAVADHEHDAPVDHRARRIGENAGRCRLAGARQRVSPSRLPAADLVGGNVAGGKRRDNDALSYRRADIGKEDRGLGHALRGPQLLPVIAVEAMQHAVGRHEIDLASGRRGRLTAPARRSSASKARCPCRDRCRPQCHIRW